MARFAFSILIFSSLAIAALPCFFEFGNLVADEEESLSLASATYRRLLRELGPALTPETLAKLAQSTDPFDIPEQPGTDLGGLRKSIREFERMLKEKGWRTPRLLDVIRRDVGVEVRDRAVSRTVVEKTVESTWRDYDVPVPQGKITEVTPDGRYLIHAVTNSATGPYVELFDLQTKQWIRTPTSEPGTHYLPALSPEGTELVFRFDSKYLVVPRTGGTLDWSLAKPLDKVTKLTGTRRMFVGLETGGPNMVDVDQPGMVSLQTFPRLKDNRKVLQIGAVGTQGDIHLLHASQADKSASLERLAVAPDGVLTLLETRGPWPGGEKNNPAPNEAVWSADGHVLAYHRRSAYVSTFEPGATAPTYLFSPAINGPEYGGVGHIVLNEKSGEAAILFYAEGAVRKNWAMIVDLKTKQIKGRVELPWHTSSVAFNPAADALLAIQEGNVKVINYRQQLDQ